MLNILSLNLPLAYQLASRGWNITNIRSHSSASPNNCKILQLQKLLGDRQGNQFTYFVTLQPENYGDNTSISEWPVTTKENPLETLKLFLNPYHHQHNLFAANEAVATFRFWLRKNLFILRSFLQLLQDFVGGFQLLHNGAYNYMQISSSSSSGPSFISAFYSSVFTLKDHERVNGNGHVAMQASHRGVATDAKQQDTSKVEFPMELTQLRERLGDVIQEYKWFGNEAYLMRWLVHHKLNVEKTELAIRETLEWRKANDIEILCQSGFKDLYPEIAKDLRADFITGWSRAGQPVGTVSYEGIQIHELIQKHGLETVRRYMYQLSTVVDTYLRTQDSTITGAVIVTNFKDVSLFSAASSASIQLCLHVTGTGFKYFPQMLDAAYFVNVGLFARVLFKLLSPMMTANVKTVRIFGTDKEEWSKALLEVIDGSQLPPEFGGWKE